MAEAETMKILTLKKIRIKSLRSLRISLLSIDSQIAPKL